MSYKRSSDNSRKYPLTRESGIDPLATINTILLAGLSAVIVWLFLARYGAGLSNRIPLFFKVSDFPNDALNCRQVILGRHLFGDHQSIFCLAQTGEPYSGSIKGEYFPFAYFVYSLLTPLGLKGSYIILCLMVLGLTALALSKLESTTRISFLLALISYPILFAFDRGNLSWLISALLFILAVRWNPSDTVIISFTKIMVLAISFSLKPVVLMVAIFCVRPRVMIKSLGVFILLNFLVPLLTIKDTFSFFDRIAHLRNLTNSRAALSNTSFSMNRSFFEILPLRHAALATCFVAIIFLLAATSGALKSKHKFAYLLALIRRKERQAFEGLLEQKSAELALAGAVLSQFLLISPTYSFTLFIIPVFLFLRGLERPLNVDKKRSLGDAMFVIYVAMMMTIVPLAGRVTIPSNDFFQMLILEILSILLTASVLFFCFFAVVKFCYYRA